MNTENIWLPADPHTLERAEAYDLHVIRFRSYRRVYMAREYRHAGERP